MKLHFLTRMMAFKISAGRFLFPYPSTNDDNQQIILQRNFSFRISFLGQLKHLMKKHKPRSIKFSFLKKGHMHIWRVRAIEKMCSKNPWECRMRNMINGQVMKIRFGSVLQYSENRIQFIWLRKKKVFCVSLKETMGRRNRKFMMQIYQKIYEWIIN